MSISCCCVCAKAFVPGDYIQAFLRSPDDPEGSWTPSVEVDSDYQQRAAKNSDSFKRKHKDCDPDKDAQYCICFRRYDFILVRVNYPMERGYRMEPEPLPSWIHITINEYNDSKVLKVHSRIHVVKEAQVGPSYSKDFSDMEIIRDLSGSVSRSYL